MNYTHRYLARITVEAETPVAVGSGEKGLNTDRLVAKDANGLPYIPGTGLTGVLRHSFEDENWANDIFGVGNENGTGSRLIVSSAFLLGDDGITVMDGLRNVNIHEGFYSYFIRLPERDHVRINDKGTADAEGHGKFDEELVHRGTRFVFELELIAGEGEKKNWDSLIQAIASPAYRIGAGTRKGFGKLKIIPELSRSIFWNLKKEKDLISYLQKSGSLNDDISNWQPLELNSSPGLKGWKSYCLKLEPKDFFAFSAGFGDDEADSKPKKERYFDWSSGKPKLTDKDYTLIPATSVKGALAHRVAFQYNLIKGNIRRDFGNNRLNTKLDWEVISNNIRKKFAIKNLNWDSDSPEWESLKNEINDLTYDGLPEWEAFKDDLINDAKEKKENSLPVMENNEAVKNLFGYAKNSEERQLGLRGSVLIEDIYLSPDKSQEKVFSHTSIDRFTNGTIDSALFQEKVSCYDEDIEIKIWVEEKAWSNDNQIKEAFEKALDDLKSGLLALGGSTTKGHGMFKESKNL